VVDWKGVWWTGRASRRLEMSRRGITGLESVAVVYGRLGHSWSVESVKRGLSACTVESPLTPHIRDIRAFTLGLSHSLTINDIFSFLGELVYLETLQLRYHSVCLLLIYHNLHIRVQYIV
jgi:hypothetical protein